MAGNASVLTEMFDVAYVYHFDETVREITVPISDAGAYFCVMFPVVTSQDGIDASTNVINSFQFVIYGASKSISIGTAFVYKNNGITDYWGPRISWADSTTKQELHIYIGASKEVSFIANHDLYILKVKGA